MTRPPIRILILAGGHGRGSNMQAIIDACQSGQIHGRVAGVIGSVAGSPALDRAAAAGIPASVVPFTKDDFAGYQSAVDAAIRSFSPDLVCLAGYLSLIHISEPTRLLSISYAVFCLKKKKKHTNIRNTPT